MNKPSLPNPDALLAALLSPAAFQFDESASCHVYALWHRGRVVYVGMSNNLPGRLDQHRFGPQPKEFDRHCAIAFHDRIEAINAERSLILHLDPPLNVVKWPTSYKGTPEEKQAAWWASLSPAKRAEHNEYIRMSKEFFENAPLPVIMGVV